MKARLFKLVVVASMLLGAMSLASAQPAGQTRQRGQEMNPEQMAQRRADEMNELVKLTEEQYKKIVELYKSESSQMQKAMQADRQKGRESMQKLQEERNAKIKAILSEEQFKV